VVVESIAGWPRREARTRVMHEKMVLIVEVAGNGYMMYVNLEKVAGNDSNAEKILEAIYIARFLDVQKWIQ